MTNKKVIWKNNQLPRDYPDDLMYFRQKTLNKVIIMWRNTFLSIWKPLPNRVNMVISKEKLEQNWIIVFTNISSCIDFVNKNYQNDEIFVIWWASIYWQFLDLGIIDKLYITFISKDYDWDCFFPDFEQKYKQTQTNIQWELNFTIWTKK